MACIAAKVRCRAVRNDLAGAIVRWQWLAQFFIADRIRLIHVGAAALGEAARATRRHRRWTGILESQGKHAPARSPFAAEHRGGRAHPSRPGVAQPAEQLAACPVSCRRGPRRWPQPALRRAFGGIRGVEQIVVGCVAAPYSRRCGPVRRSGGPSILAPAYRGAVQPCATDRKRRGCPRRTARDVRQSRSSRSPCSASASLRRHRRDIERATR